MDQPGKVASPARGQLNRKMNNSLFAFAPDNLVSRDGFGSPVPRQPAHLYTQAESGAYLRDSSRVPRRRPFKTAIRHRVSPEFIESRSCVPMAFTAVVRRHGASKPQSSSERVLPWQVTMDQYIFSSLSHNHYWYEEGMSKVPALRDQDCSNMINHRRNKYHYYCYYDKIYLQFIDIGGVECTTGLRN